MEKHGFWHKAFHLYYDGFRNMQLGKTLWLIIGIKLVIIFLVLKLFFFPNYIKQNAEKGQEAEFVAGKLLEASPPVSDASVSPKSPEIPDNPNIHK